MHPAQAPVLGVFVEGQRRLGIHYFQLFDSIIKNKIFFYQKFSKISESKHLKMYGEKNDTSIDGMISAYHLSALFNSFLFLCDS